VPIADGTPSITFSLYTSSTPVIGESPAWTETDSPVVHDGYYTTTLGDTNDLSNLDWADTTYWLGVTVGSGPELPPRQRIGAVPFALVAANGGAQVEVRADGDCDGTTATQGLLRIRQSTQMAQICALSGQWVDLVAVGATAPLYAFTTHTFSTCGATGMTGPSLPSCVSAYGTSWASNPAWFSMVAQGIQRWTVPESGTYRVRACGAGGGGSGQSPNYPGRGACVQGDVALTQGDVLQILVGQRGGSSAVYTGGGGGGSFVVSASNTPLVIGGGGGGTSRGGFDRTAVTDASLTTVGKNSVLATGGSGGGGGGIWSTDNNWAGAGGGFSGNGGDGRFYNSALAQGGRSFLNGGAGGTCSDCPNAGAGGFGGGGGAFHAETSGGGGGYSGGAGGAAGGGTGAGQWEGGGGGSYNVGTNPLQFLQSSPTDGLVTITRL
jgi:hypothetical protein